MDTATARLTPLELDLIQVAKGRVPIEEFRLLTCCSTCQYFERVPATPDNNEDLRGHIRTDHADLILRSSV
jgi:hypothetical protein